MKKLAYFLPAILFYALIFFLSSQNLGFSVPGNWLDKFPHAMAYTVMGFLISLGFFHLLPKSTALAVILAFSSGAALGALDEVHQKYTRGRVSDPKDALADAVGVALGVAVFWYLKRKKSKSPAA
jgi:VanZ family protein